LRRDYTGWKVAKEEFLYQGNWLDTGSQTFDFPTSRGHKAWSSPYNAPLAYLTYPFRLDSEAGPFIQPIQDLRMRLGQARRYRPSASDIASFVRVESTTPVGGRGPREVQVDEAGRELAVVLRDLLINNRDIFSEVEGELHRLHGHIDGISFKSDWRGVGICYKTGRTGEDIPASLESDGVLLTTFLLWRLYTAAPNFKLCLEEPENGVHLAGMEDRYQLLKQFAMQDNNGRNLQILVATHSRDFLNAIRSRTDILTQVRVVEYSPHTGTAIHPLTHWKQVDSLLDEFKDQMGDLWWSQRLKSGW
jgi:predicted ATPase